MANQEKVAFAMVTHFLPGFLALPPFFPAVASTVRGSGPSFSPFGTRGAGGAHLHPCACVWDTVVPSPWLQAYTECGRTVWLAGCKLGKAAEGTTVHAKCKGSADLLMARETCTDKENWAKRMCVHDNHATQWRFGPWRSTWTMMIS